MRRWLMILALLLVALPLAAALLLRVLLSPDVLVPAVERQATAFVGRRVTIGGARARLFPTAGLAITDLRVAGPRPLSAEEVIVGAGLVALVNRRIDDAIVRVRNGRITLDGPADPDAPAQPVVVDGPPAIAILAVREISFENVVLAGGGRELRLDLQGALAGDRLDVVRLAARSGSTTIEGNGTVTSLARRDGTFSLTSPMVDVDEVLAILKALTPAGPQAAAPAVGHVRARVQADAARGLGYDVTRLDTELELRGTTLLARPLTFEFYGGRYDSTLDLDLATSTITHEATLTGASVERLLALAGKAGAATGALDVTMRVQGSGPDFPSAARAVHGTAGIRVSRGTVAGLDVVRQSFRLLGVAAPQTPQGERFESITATVALSGRAMATDHFHMHSPDFDLTGRLRIAADRQLAGTADLTLSEALSKEAQRRNRDLRLTFEDGRITLPATIGGTLTHPQVMLDLNAALARAARNRLQAEIDKMKKKATGELKRQLERLIK